MTLLIKRPLCVALGIVLSQIPTLVHAEDIEEVSVIATRTEQPLSEQLSGLFLLGEAQLERVNAVHIQQALSQVPGVSMQRGNGQESLPGIRSAVLTGAGACGSVLILEEAIPVRGAGVCNVNELFDTHFEQAQRIEVVRGANTAFYGSNALTGSVNVVLPHTGRDRASIEVGSNSYVRAKAAISYEGGRLYASLTDDGGYRDDSGYRQQKYSWRHQAQVGNWQLQAGATYTDLDQQTAGFIVGQDSYLDRDLARQNLDPEGFRDTQSFRAWLKASKELSPTTTLNTAVYVRDAEMDFRLHFLPGDPLEQNAQRGIGWQSALTISANESLIWTIGIDGDITDSELAQSQEQATQGSAFLSATIPTGIHYDYQVDAQQFGAFAHLDWSISDQWRLVVGARAERVDYEYDNLSLDGRTRDDGSECGFGGCRYSRPADRDDDFSHTSPKLELSYKPNEFWTLSAQISDSFRAPQATELYRLQRAQTVADLDIVESLSTQFSANYNSETLSVGASVYAMDIDNLIVRDSDFFNVDGQSTRSRGIELSVRNELGQRWSWRLVSSWAEHEYSSDFIVGGQNFNGNLVDTAPKFFGSAFLNYTPRNDFNLEVELQRVGSYFLSPDNQSAYPGHTLLNARANYQPSDHWAFSLRVLNIADERYAERADFTSFTDERYFPGEPRSAFLQAQYSF